MTFTEMPLLLFRVPTINSWLKLIFFCWRARMLLFMKAVTKSPSSPNSNLSSSAFSSSFLERRMGKIPKQRCVDIVGDPLCILE
jgi:hypothetical protein